MELVAAPVDVPALVESVDPAVVLASYAPEAGAVVVMKGEELPHSPVFTPDLGLTVDGSVAGEAASSLRGLAVAALGVDLARGLGWTGASLSASAQTFLGDAPPAAWGSLQGLTNIDATPTAGLGELYLRQELFGARLRLDGGRIDANADHAASGVGGSFLNPGLNGTPTIVGMPTYPEPALGLGAAAFDGGRLSPRVAWFPGEGQPFAIGQVNLRTGGGNIGLGAWQGASQGAYLMIDEPVVYRGEAPALSVFATGGYGDPATADFVAHAGGGFVVDGLPFGREADRLGLGASWVALAAPVEGGVAGEAVIEGFYTVTGSDHLNLTVDAQHLVQPGGIGGSALTLRTELFL